MKEYHKIQGLYKRDEKTHKFIIGDYSMPEFQLLKDIEWEFTEKVDGTNIRIIWDTKKVRINGKTDNASIPSFLINKLNERFDEEKFRYYFPETSVTLYGEGYGAKIQKGGGNYIKDGTDFVLFDVFIDDIWLERKNVEDISKKLNIKTVPIIGRGNLDDAENIVKSDLKSIWGDFYAEGIVTRPVVELRTRRGDRIITKIKRKDY